MAMVVWCQEIILQRYLCFTVSRGCFLINSMEQFVDQFLQWVSQQNLLIIYLALFLSAVAENLFPPVPGDTITAFGAFLVGTGQLGYMPVYAVTTMGSVAGFILLVFVGRMVNREYFIEKDFKVFPAQQIITAEQWFSRFGWFVVLGNRFLPGIRSVIAIAAGMARLNLSRTTFLAFVSAMVWNFLWIHAGYTLGSNWTVVREKLSDIMARYNLVVGGFLSIVALVLLVRLVRNLRTRSS